MTVLAHYQRELKARGYKSDPAQLRAVEALDRCAREWRHFKEKRRRARGLVCGEYRAEIDALADTADERAVGQIDLDAAGLDVLDGLWDEVKEAEPHPERGEGSSSPAAYPRAEDPSLRSG